jgi:hypothetical protein
MHGERTIDILGRCDIVATPCGHSSQPIVTFIPHHDRKASAVAHNEQHLLLGIDCTGGIWCLIGMKGAELGKPKFG